MPQCQFLFIMSVYCRKAPKMKVLEKIWKNHRNSIIQEDPGSQKGSRSSATGWPHPPQARPGLARAWAWWAHLGHRLASPLRLFISSEAKTLNTRPKFYEKFQSAATIADEIRGTENLCFGTLPGRGIVPRAISIDSTAISIAAADSHDEEGVVLPRG